MDDSTEVSVARCSEGNIFWRIALVRTCNASSPVADKKLPTATKKYHGECSARTPANTKDIVIANTHL